MFSKKRIVALVSVAALMAGLSLVTLPAQAAPAAGAFTLLNQTLSAFPCDGGAASLPRVNPQTPRTFGCGPATFTGTFRGRTPDGTLFTAGTLTTTFTYTEPCAASVPGLPPQGAASGTILVDGAAHGFAAFDWVRVGASAVISIGGTSGTAGVGIAAFGAAVGFGTCANPGSATVDVVGTAAGA